MADIHFITGLFLAGFLFATGLAGLLVRRNIIFILLSIEIMLNAASVAFITAGAVRKQPDGQVMYFFILAAAAAEVAVGLGLILNLLHKYKTLDTNQYNQLHG